MKKVLFVCTGNSCRSVMGEFLFNSWVRRLGLDGWEARSCGIAAQRHFPLPSGVKKVLAARDISDVQHTPQLISRHLMDWADDVYAMAENHYEVLRELYPEHRDKIGLFLERAGQGHSSVHDPIGQPDDVYETCCRVIETGIRNLLENHAKPTESPRP